MVRFRCAMFSAQEGVGLKVRGIIPAQRLRSLCSSSGVPRLLGKPLNQVQGTEGRILHRHGCCSIIQIAALAPGHNEDLAMSSMKTNRLDIVIAQQAYGVALDLAPSLFRPAASAIGSHRIDIRRM